jgi:hypothetical protein
MGELHTAVENAIYHLYAFWQVLGAVDYLKLIFYKNKNIKSNWKILSLVVLIFKTMESIESIRINDFQNEIQERIAMDPIINIWRLIDVFSSGINSRDHQA